MRQKCLAVLVAAVLASVAVPAPATGPNQPGERYASVTWVLDGERRPQSRKVKIRGRPDGYACQYRMHRASARETETTVTIKLLVHWHAIPPGQACAAVAASIPASVKLDEPLGKRKLRHAPTNDPGAG